jgi:hypothetical protein
MQLIDHAADERCQRAREHAAAARGDPDEAGVRPGAFEGDDRRQLQQRIADSIARDVNERRCGVGMEVGKRGHAQ